MNFSGLKEFILAELEQKLAPHLEYHSVGHTLDVYRVAAFLAREEGISAKEETLLLTAALLHDSGFIEDARNHEERSCKLARSILPGYGYTSEETDLICGMILATRIPQKPGNLLEMILCDADLDYLGRDDFFSTARKLFHELRTTGSIKDEDEWNRLQVAFLEQQHYFTNTSIKLRKAKKEAHLEMLRSSL